MTEGLVSIITTLYDSGSYIGRTIESVLSQTYTNWEMVITDDCSVDNGPAIVEEYMKKDSRIRLLRLAENGGPGIARNNSIRNANGQYIAFLDSDDMWKPDKLEKQLALMDKTGCGVVYSSIPCVTGVMLRLASGKMKITAKFLSLVVLSSVAVFFVTFLLAIVVVNDMAVNDKVIEWIFQRFVHYLTSGTLGLSVDMQLGFPDRGPIDVIWTPFLNIINQITGSGEILSPVNPVFHFTGISLTNVRTVFGTLLIYTNYLQYALYILGLSSLCYILKILSIHFHNLFINTVFYYFCALLSMGWFEFYFFHLDIIEIPAMILLLHILYLLFPNKPDKTVKV